MFAEMLVGLRSSLVECITHTAIAIKTHSFVCIHALAFADGWTSSVGCRMFWGPSQVRHGCSCLCVLLLHTHTIKHLFEFSVTALLLRCTRSANRGI